MEDRREVIVQALHRCIRETGYASTSLTAIAVKARMSPSHIKYYFENKDAILEYYLDRLCRQIVEDLRAIEEEDPAEWLRRFADYYIRNPRISRVGLGVLVEIFGVSVHLPKLRDIKIAYDQQIRELLVAFFRRVGTVDVTPEVAAEIVQALEAGLKYNAVFQEGYDPDKASAAFLTGVRRLAGLDVAGHRTSRPRLARARSCEA